MSLSEPLLDKYGQKWFQLLNSTSSLPRWTSMVRGGPTKRLDAGNLFQCQL